MYDRFNQALATPEFQNKGLHTRFYSEMSKQGYDAILDLNDMRYSGYKNIAKSPTVIFGKNVVEKISNQKLDNATLNEKAIKYIMGQQGKQSAKFYGTVAAAITTRNRIRDDKRVKKYLSEHPNSELSRKEIIKLYKNKKLK